jgi:hypothetical protein
MERDYCLPGCANRGIAHGTGRQQFGFLAQEFRFVG